jgi:cyclophilin family peptidyl-prolyl cis-trans isomerase
MRHWGELARCIACSVNCTSGAAGRVVRKQRRFALINAFWIVVAMGLVPVAAQNETRSSDAEATTTPEGPKVTVVTPSTLQPIHTLVEAELRADTLRFRTGSPVEIRFVIRNKTESYVQLDVPLGALAAKLPLGFKQPGIGLPMEHVFSGENFRALSVAAEGNPFLGERIYRAPSRTVPPIVIEPYGVVGIQFDATRFYPDLRREGRYELKWKPYGGLIESNTLKIEIHRHRQVRLDTDLGMLTVRLLYDDAPRTVERFLELVENGEYDRTLLFNVTPSQWILGGCPLGNGQGRARDGKTIEAEFNSTPFMRGTVGMSLARNPRTGEIDPHSASSQFFICLSRNPRLDGDNTAFAQIEGPESMETLGRIESAPVDAAGRPVKPIMIRSAVIVDAPTPP